MTSRVLLGTMILTSFIFAESIFGGAADRRELATIHDDDFENGIDAWQPTDAKAWKLVDVDGNQVYSLFQQSKYKPPFRSPPNISLLREKMVGDFELRAKVLTTTRDYGHRSMCVFFGYQDPTHYYYVHFGQQADEHANQIFIVNEAPRKKISTTTTSGTPWDEHWHQVKIIRRVDTGRIEVYWDDMSKPVMTATDKRFTWGQVGLGSFDDTGNWDDFRLKGILVKRPDATAGQSK